VKCSTLCGSSATGGITPCSRLWDVSGAGSGPLIDDEPRGGGFGHELPPPHGSAARTQRQLSFAIKSGSWPLLVKQGCAPVFFGAWSAFGPRNGLPAGPAGPLEQARKSGFTSARLNQARWSERGIVWSAFSVAFLYSVPSVGTFRQIPAKRFAEASHVMATRPMCTTSVASSPMICTPISFKSSWRKSSFRKPS
jgi:hypothetical protein